jgi:regulator of RNase E activity RraA
MALSVAEICDSIAQNPEFEQRTRLFVGEFPIYSAKPRLRGPLKVVKPVADRVIWRKQLIDSLQAGFVSVIENYSINEYACFEWADIEGHNFSRSTSGGLIVNGALRNSFSISHVDTLCIQARHVNPKPFQMPNMSQTNGELAFPFPSGGYAIGDADGLIVLQNRSVLDDLGLSDR